MSEAIVEIYVAVVVGRCTMLRLGCNLTSSQDESLDTLVILSQFEHGNFREKMSVTIPLVAAYRDVEEGEERRGKERPGINARPPAAALLVPYLYVISRAGVNFWRVTTSFRPLSPCRLAKRLCGP